MIGKYHDRYYHVSSSVDSSGNRTIWLFSPVDGLSLLNTYGNSSVYKATVPASDIRELIRLIVFSTQWAGETVAIKNMIATTSVSQVVHNSRRSRVSKPTIEVEIESHNAAFSREHSFTPYRIERGEPISWRHHVPLNECESFTLEIIMDNGTVNTKSLSKAELIEVFQSLVLDLRDPPVFLPKTASNPEYKKLKRKQKSETKDVKKKKAKLEPV